jgi:hypothetical protein
VEDQFCRRVTDDYAAPSATLHNTFFKEDVRLPFLAKALLAPLHLDIMNSGNNIIIVCFSMR